MPLTVHTTIEDEEGKTLETRESKLYTLAELKAADDDEIERDAVSKAEDWLREGVAEYGWWTDTLDGDISDLFEACGISGKMSEANFDLDRGDYFALPKGVRVDHDKFLLALKLYLAGVDVRKALLGWGGGEERPLAAIGTQVRRFDLRTRDARIIRDSGLAISINYWGGGRTSTNSFEWDGWQDDQISQQTRDDADELLADLHHEALRLLREELDWLYSDENLDGLAEANGYTFNRYGKRSDG